MNNTTIEMLKKRELDKCVILLNCVPVNIYMNEGDDYINERRLYLFYEMGLDGKRRFVAPALEKDMPKTSDWYNFFQELKKRKIETILFAVIPKIKEIKDALKLSYKDVEVFDSYDKTIEKLRKYNTYNHFYEIYKEMRKIYVAKDEVEYQLNYEIFKEKYNNYPFIMDLLNKDIEELRKNYKYPYELRRMIYEFNHSMEIRKKFSELAHKQSYSSKDEFIKEIIKFIHNSEKAVPYSKKDWLEVVNTIYKLKGEMIKPYM